MQFLLASGNNPVSHVLDAPVRIGGMEPYSGLTLQVVTLFVGLIAFMAVLLYASKNISTGNESMGHRRYLSRGRFAQVIEVMCSEAFRSAVNQLPGYDASETGTILTLEQAFGATR